MLFADDDARTYCNTPYLERFGRGAVPEALLANPSASQFGISPNGRGRSRVFLPHTSAARFASMLVLFLLHAGLVAPSAVRPPLGLAFTPAGLLFPYYIGVGFRLRELGLLQPNTPLGGSSAGAIVAAALACGLTETEVRSGLNRLLEDVRDGQRLNAALRKQLEVILTEDAHETARAHGLSVGYLEVLPRPGRRIVSEWSSKADLIDTIAASCNWPLFFSRWPLVWCRNALCLDGFFAVSRARFGCPELDAERTLAITALPRVELPAFDGVDVIRPDGFTSAPLPLGNQEWFSYALAPAEDATIDEMVVLGRTHASIWAEAQREVEQV